MEAMGFDVSDFIPCEICEAPAVDIHHIHCRGMGGSKDKDVIENLMAVCRHCHNYYGDITELELFLTELHLLRLKAKGVIIEKSPQINDANFC